MYTSASVPIGNLPTKRRNEMRTRFLTIAVALVSLFAAQEAVAKKSSPKTAEASKKHHKKHKKTGAANTTAPTIQAAPRMS
jgi:hypothetical protein